MTREAVASGLFYPDNKKELTALIEKLKPKKTNKCSAQGIILPHAGYSFSGQVAAATIAKVFPSKDIIMLGPNHTGQGKSFALDSAQSWQTPYGKVKINQSLSEKIINSGSLIEFDSLAHRDEHSLEVELPLLQHFFVDFNIIPISCRQAKKEIYQQVAKQIFQGLKNNLKDTLIIASTDLTHYQSEQIARQKDRQTIEAILELDPEKFCRESKKKDNTMCGAAPVAITLYLLAQKLKKAELVLYQTSANTNYNYNSVVGYVGIILK